MTIEQMYRTMQPLGELRSLVHTVVWATKRLNLTAIQEFNALVALYFDPQIWRVVESSQEVDLDVSYYKDHC